MKPDKIIKLILIVLLLLCLFKLPYGFYILVRFVALVGFARLALLCSHHQNKETEMIIYVALAILFQPLLKIPLGRNLWNIVDVVVAVGLFLSLFTSKDKKEE